MMIDVVQCARGSVLGLVVIALGWAQATAAQSVSYHGFDPFVLSAGSPPQVLFFAEVTGSPTRVTLDFNPGQLGAPTTFSLHDDGASGDRAAGDRIYSVQLPSAQILAAIRASDVQRVFVGFLNVSNGTTNVFRGNIFADVYTSGAGVFPIAQLSPTVQATSRLVNINDPAYFSGGDITHVTREFYRWFGDDYDFINLIYTPARFSNRNHFAVRNDVEGIGMARFNNSSTYGSLGRLQGISQFPIPDYFDGAETAHIHELAHQWVNFLNFAPLGTAIPHWPLSSMAGGVMGFSIGGTGGEGGNFACDVVDRSGQIVLNRRPDEPVFNDLELYLMGLLPASQVRQQIVFTDQTAALSLTCTGQTFTGAVTRLSANDVIAQYGARRPAAGDAPTRFRIATILVTRDGLASREAMWLYSWFADRAEWRAPLPIHSGFVKATGMPFYVATGQRASLDMRIGVAIPDFSILPTPGTVTTTAGTPVTFKINALPTGQAYAGDVSFSCADLPAHASCVFTPSHAAPNDRGAEVTLTIATRDASAAVSAGTHVIVVNGAADAVQHNTVVALTVR